MVVPARSGGRIRLPVGALLAVDRIFFFLGAVAAGWLAYLTVHQIVIGGLHDWWLTLVLWVLVAYLLLPRVQTILAHIYVPNYFIGRTRINEGVLGDPVNIALLGNEKQVRFSMATAGWQLADQLGFRSGLRIVASTLTRRPYPTAPVSNLYLFNRIQDFAFEQEVADSPAQRHHVRFWATPPGWRLPGGTPVDWVAAGTFDRKVGLSDFTLQVTHKVADDTDVERDHVVETLLTGNPAATKTVLQHFSSGYHSHNGGGDAIQTDGNLPVVDLTKVWVKVARSAASAAGSILGAADLEAAARSVLAVVRDTAASNQGKRPLALYTSLVLMLLRVVAALLSVLAVVAVPSTPVRWLELAAVAVAALGYLEIIRRTFIGYPLARIIAMSLSVVAIAAALRLGHRTDELATVLWTLGLGLDVGILFSLSGDDVRDYHVRSVAKRRG